MRLRFHRRPNAKRRQLGVSMVSMLIALGLGGVVSLAMMRLFANSQLSARAVSQIGDHTMLRSNITTMLRNPTACLKTFEPLLFPDASPQTLKIKDRSNQDVFKDGDKVGGLTISSIMAETGAAAADGIYTVKVTLVSSKRKVAGQKTGGRATYTDHFYTNVFAPTATNRASQCIYESSEGWVIVKSHNTYLYPEAGNKGVDLSAAGRLLRQRQGDRHRGSRQRRRHHQSWQKAQRRQDRQCAG